MCYKFKCLLKLIIIIIFCINIKCLQAFNVNFQYNYNLQVEPFNTQIYKRELNQFFDKASFSLNGFEKIDTIPIPFPIDICLFNLDGTKYVSALHKTSNGIRHFVVLKMMDKSYELIANIPTPNGIAMDCLNFNNKGYVAIAFNLTQPIRYAKDGSPLYEIAGNHLRPVQYFSAPHLLSVYLRHSGNDLFLLHTYTNSEDTPNLYCPYFKWFGTSFNKMGHIPCSNARQLAPFSIDYESYVAVANYADQSGRTNTYSEIYKFSREKKKFLLFQKIKTNGAVDVKYFYVPYNEARRKHFLVFGNSITTTSMMKNKKLKQEVTHLEADSIFYVYDNGQFIPYQKLPLYAVKKFLPVQNIEAEKFILLVACTDQDIRIYNLNDWKFEESNVQFTEGALGKGVSNMRIYREDDKSYLIIANELMPGNDTNIFLPIFKQEEDANALRQQIIDWAKQETQRLKMFKIKDLRNRVEEKLKRLEQLKHLPNINNIPQANIHTVTTEKLIYPKLQMYNNYWTILDYINQGLDKLDEDFKRKQRLKRNPKVSDSNETTEYVYEALNVNTLTVNECLKAKKINKVATENPVFENIKADKIIVTGKYNETTKERFNDMQDIISDNESMSVRNLKIRGKLNEYTWQDLFNNTLKRKADLQFLKNSIRIQSLKTDTIVVNSDKVNEQNLAALIPIDSGKYVINQDIQFKEAVVVNELIVLERLNNLHVFNGHLSVLLKNSNHTQVIEGVKNVSDVKVLQPISIAGHQLESIAPYKFINEPLLLQGNFMINGDTFIHHHLHASDIIDLKEKLSVNQILTRGLRMDKTLRNLNLKFVHPLKVNNSLISVVNGNNLQRLIKLDQDDIQIIEGEKIFTGNLEITRGFSEVKNLNGIDIEKLQQNAFLKNTNQSIKVPIKMAKLTAKSIESSEIILNNRNLSDYLTLTGNQLIQGSLIVDAFKAFNLEVEHLNINSKIFNQDLNDIYQQKSRNFPLESIFQENRKFHGSIYVQNLILNTTINGKPVVDIENHLLQLQGNIKYVGDFKFNYAMNVINMTFQGKLNDILAQDFGKCWLQKKDKQQIFTAGQTFATLRAESGIQLLNKLNGFTIDDFYKQTYWINRDEYFQNVNFENPIEITGSLTTQTINGLTVPQDIVFKNNKNSNTVLNSLTIDKDLIVEGNIQKISSINDINLWQLQKLLDGSSEDTLYVENAYFSQAIPHYKTLNKHNIRQTLDAVWLSNENVILPHHVELADAYFEGLLELKGPINEMNLNYLKENYFSKTKSQEISAEIIFAEGVSCIKDLNVNNLQVFGKLLEEESGTLFDFNKFVQNTVKTSGPHIISGNWTLNRAIVLGHINTVLINQLNLVNDIVHNNHQTQPYDINAVKIFKNAEIENLFADNLSMLNKVPVVQWIRDSVYLYENFTIRGTTRIDSLNVYNNLEVIGRLNNISFNKHNLLLKDVHQHIPGMMKIISYLPKEKRFLTNNIENLNTDLINQLHMPTFMKQLISKNLNTEIKSHLIFNHPVKVETYEGPEGFVTQNQWNGRNNDKQARLTSDHIEGNDNKFLPLKDLLSEVTNEYSYKIAYFDIEQIIETKSDEIISISLNINSSIENILIVLNTKQNNSRVYKRINEKEQYEETDDFEWLPHDPISLKIIQKRFELFQPVPMDTLQTFLNRDFQNIYQALAYTPNRYSNFEFLNETCIIYQEPLAGSIVLTNYCLDANKENIINLPNNTQQIKLLEKELVALLTDNSVLIYNISSKPAKLLQQLAALNPKEIAYGIFNNRSYLAILNTAKTNALHQDFVEIYRSINTSDFKLYQFIKCLQPCSLKFSYIDKSNDFLLHLTSNSPTAPYLIYQYQGILAFRSILSDSILPNGIKNHVILKLYGIDQYLVGLLNEEQVTFMKIGLKRI